MTPQIRERLKQAIAEAEREQKNAGGVVTATTVEQLRETFLTALKENQEEDVRNAN